MFKSERLFLKYPGAARTGWQLRSRQSRNNITIDSSQGRQLRWIRLRLYFEGLCKNESAILTIRIWVLV